VHLTATLRHMPRRELTSDEAAAYLGITRRTLWNLMRRPDGGFPQPRKVGRTLLWRTTQLDAWRAQHPARRKPQSAAVPEPPEIGPVRPAGTPDTPSRTGTA
jgi:prophage regulatory protein